MSIQINDNEWRPMSAPMTFPALVQWADGKCAVLNANTYTAPGYFSSVLRWQPFKQPDLPKKDAFTEWRGCKLDTEGSCTMREAFDGGVAHANKRFSDGVEKLSKHFDTNKRHCFHQLIADLRALARGEEADK